MPKFMQMLISEERPSKMDEKTAAHSLCSTSCTFWSVKDDRDFPSIALQQWCKPHQKTLFHRRIKCAQGNTSTIFKLSQVENSKSDLNRCVLFLCLCSLLSVSAHPWIQNCSSGEAWKERGQEKGMRMHTGKHFVCPHVLQLDAVQCTHFSKKLVAAMWLPIGDGLFGSSAGILPHHSLFGN